MKNLLHYFECILKTFHLQWTSEEELQHKSEILDDLEAAIEAVEADEKEKGAKVSETSLTMRRLLAASKESLNRSRLSLNEAKVS